MYSLFLLHLILRIVLLYETHHHPGQEELARHLQIFIKPMFALSVSIFWVRLLQVMG